MVVAAVKEIRRYQRHTELLIPFAPFSCVVRSVQEEVLHNVFAWKKDAIKAL